MILNKLRLAPLRASTNLPQGQHDHSLTYMLVLLLLLIFGPIIGLHVAFVLQQAPSEEYLVQHGIARENGPS
jgi:hypothetical protein